MTASENSFSKHGLSEIFLICSIVFKFIFLVCGVFGNVLVIIYQVFLNKNNTQTSFLVLNLAIGDLLSCVLVFSTGIVQLFRILYEIDQNHGEFFCQLFYSSAGM